MYVYDARIARWGLGNGMFFFIAKLQKKRRTNRFFVTRNLGWETNNMEQLE